MSDLTLYSYPTSNGIVPMIFLQELKDAYGGPTFKFVQMSRDILTSDWYPKISPTGRFPAIVHGDFKVFETSAILLYLAQEFDKDRKYSYDPVKQPELYSEELQWIFFAHGALGPIQGQAYHFNEGAPEQIDYAVNRFNGETKRNYKVLETRLQGRDFVVGEGKGRFGLADIKLYGWVRISHVAKIDLSEFPNIKAWLDRINSRPGVIEGSKIPTQL